MKKITLILILFLSISSFSQRTLITGTVTDDIGIVANAHVINITSNEGTFTDSKGYFSIHAQQGDVLQITSIQHHPKKMKVSSITMKRKQINILLEIEEYILEEIEVKKTELLQILAADAKKTPPNISEEKSKKATDFGQASETTILTPKSKEKLDIERKTDPVLAFDGVTLLQLDLFTSKNDKKLKQRLKKAVFKAHLPERIIEIVGKQNFTTSMNIPEDQILKFINFSIDQEMETNVQREENLKVIESLKSKSVQYLKEQNR